MLWDGLRGAARGFSRNLVVVPRVVCGKVGWVGVQGLGGDERVRMGSRGQTGSGGR